MTARNYRSLALAWFPDSQEKRAFYFIAAVVMSVALALAVLVTLVDVPPKERRAREVVPERVARFITQRPRPAPPPPVATPTPRPLPTPRPRVVRKTETQAEKNKPVTAQEKKARDKAAQSGLLALGEEIADLMDTSDVGALVGAEVRRSSARAQQSSTANTDLLSADIGRGSGGVNTTDYVAAVGSAPLAQRDITLVKQSLLRNHGVEEPTTDGNSAAHERTGGVRSEEEVTIVFDQHKGQLFTIYNRERRKKPGLKGKIVLEITIAPDGTVSEVKIASSELNDAGLERRLLMRVKQFKFAAKQVESVTVTFPIEFLPS